VSIIKKLLIKVGILKKKKYKTEEQIHNEKINYISEKLFYVRDDLIKLLPEDLRYEFFMQSYISGGCIYSLYHDKEPKDYDFFVESDGLVAKLRDYFIKESSYQGEIRSGGLHKGINMTITQNAISLGEYQIVTQWTGSPKEVITQFDFKHNMVYWKDAKLICLSDWKFVKGNRLYYRR
jgi:hypothetical protein